ncbi:unnamed protein product [Cylindrotheca closterium]|uniref:Uncharacterized protein n=1 Tax=Cylindrotheca closterium TaxID=2856 RepID=A0AAD2JHH0_9STRA|nr:unnamed protein product [Cylindrotheca closterium]
MDGSTIRWVHDKLQEAALGFRGDVSASIKFDIGTTLYYRLRPKELEDDLFNVADLINNGNLRRRPDFATMNMKAAEKARCISAFESARNYAIHGLRLLSDKRWVDNRPLTLRLYTLAAEMEMILGNVEMAAKYREDILNYGNFSIMETLPLKLSKAKSLSEVALKFEEAVAYGLAVLKELGCKLVLSKSLVPAQAIVKLMLVLSKVKKLDAHSIASIGTMSDPKEKAIASILAYIKYASYNNGNIYLHTICCCKLIEMTLKYGSNEFSGIAFGTLGSTVVLVQQDYETALRIFELASRVQEMSGNTRTSEYLY